MIQLVIIHAVYSSKLDLVACLLQSQRASIHLIKKMYKAKVAFRHTEGHFSVSHDIARLCWICKRYPTSETHVMAGKSPYRENMHYLYVLIYCLWWCTTLNYLPAQSGADPRITFQYIQTSCSYGCLLYCVCPEKGGNNCLFVIWLLEENSSEQ